MEYVLIPVFAVLAMAIAYCWELLFQKKSKKPTRKPDT